MYIQLFIWFSGEGDVPKGSPNVGGGYRVSKINQTTSKRHILRRNFEFNISVTVFQQ